MPLLVVELGFEPVLWWPGGATAPQLSGTGLLASLLPYILQLAPGIEKVLSHVFRRLSLLFFIIHSCCIVY
jgi:hypothetical protein